MATRMRPAEGYGGRPRRRREAWSIDNPGNRAARRELLEAIEDAAAAEIAGTEPLLDCGCGTGWLLEALAERGVAPERLHGVDRDAQRVAAARERVPGARVAVGRADDLGYLEDMFAAVFFIVSLSSMDSYDAARTALVEARRVLRPGGVALCYEPRIPNPLNLSARLNLSTRRISRAALAGIEGLDMEASRSLTLIPPLGRRLGRVTPRLHPVLSRVPVLRSHQLLILREPLQTN